MCNPVFYMPVFPVWVINFSEAAKDSIGRNRTQGADSAERGGAVCKLFHGHRAA